MSEHDNLAAGELTQALEAAPKSKKAPISHLQQVPKLIQELVQKDIRVLLTKTGFEIHGFYKAVFLKIDLSSDGHLVAIDAKDQRCLIQDVNDVVKINYQWWKKSRTKSKEWVEPPKEWLSEFMRLGLVKRQMMVIPGDDDF